MSENKRIPHPALWVTTSYFAEGLAYAMVMGGVAGTMFKNLGHSDGEITVAVGSISVVWSLKPFWAAFLEAYKTKKFFILVMELFMTFLLAGVAFSLQLPSYFRTIIATLWVIAFASATQDICIDGVYITSLDKKGQAAWSGVQGAFWNAARILAATGIVWLADQLMKHGRDAKTAWMYGFMLSAVVMAALLAYHYFLLPTGSATKNPGLSDALTSFVRKKSIWGMLLFVFLYRTGEGFLLVEAPLFLQAPLKDGGVGLSLGEKAFIDGTVSTVVSIVAGLLGGAFISRFSLKRSLLFLAFCMNVPHICYIYLSYAVSPETPLSLQTVMILVSIEKFGYGFGFMGNMVYMMQQIAPGRHKMTHYAYATALMNLVLWPTQTLSGPLADRLGYRHFFVFVLIASIPSIIAAWKAPFPDPPEVEEAEAQSG